MPKEETSLPRMADDAERLFERVTQKEAKQHQSERELTPQLLADLGFPKVEDVTRAADKIRGYTHQNNWGLGVCLITTDKGKLICGPVVMKAWADYGKRRMA